MGSLIHRSSDLACRRVRTGSFCSNDQFLAVVTEGEEIVVSETRGRQPLHHFDPAGETVCISGAPQGPLIAVAGSEGNLSVWRVLPQQLLIGSVSLGWKPSCIAWGKNSELIAVGGQDVRLFRISEGAIQPQGISVIEWFARYRPDLLQDSALDERCLSEDGIDMRPHGQYTTKHLGVASIALARDASLLAMGFRSNTVVVIPVASLTKAQVEIESYAPPEELYASHTRWIVDLLFSKNTSELALRQSNGMGWIVDRGTRRWRLVGDCTCLGDWAFDAAIGLFHKELEALTEVRSLRTQQPIAYLPGRLELVSEDVAQSRMMIQSQWNRKISLIAVEDK
jgi:WD40 repeat protein